LRKEAVWDRDRKRFVRKEDFGGRRLVKDWWLQDLAPDATSIAEIVDGLEDAVAELRGLQGQGVTLSEGSDMEAGHAVLVTTEPAVANRFDFELEQGGGEEGDGPALPDFDQYFKKPIFIPLFIWDNGDMRPFQGYCRGNGPIGDEEEWEQTIGVFTAEGKYYSILIDTRVRCA
jgi:hypothetical protein